ncbi:unnamed protein product [Gulo gulo]|uniref:Large ribosomal subunit protein uL22 n=1 Tax=Gulo gulo TaxID=48420 RepID=A0A9X9LF20_GULGU|nr:unnamed protein product [Gulo gulo]
MLKTAEWNAELKGLDVDSLVMEYMRMNKAPKLRQRARGRVNPYMSFPCHTEMILTEKSRLSLNQKRRLHRR